MSKKPDGKKPTAVKVKAFKVKEPGKKPDFRPRAERLPPADPVEQAFKASSQEVFRILDGTLDTYGIKATTGLLEKPEGTVVLAVDLIRDKPVIRILESSFPGITSHRNFFLPVKTLRFEQIMAVTEIETFTWQVNVHAFLRKVLASFLTRENLYPPKSIKEEQQKLEAALFVADAKKLAQAREEEKQMVTVDVSGAIKMTPAAFFGVKDGHSRLYVCTDETGHEAYFRAEYLAGNQALTLLVCDEAHELYQSFASQEKLIRIHLSTLPQDTKPYGCVSDRKYASECVRQYLKKVGLAFGIKPKRQIKEATKVA